MLKDFPPSASRHSSADKAKGHVRTKSRCDFEQPLPAERGFREHIKRVASVAAASALPPRQVRRRSGNVFFRFSPDTKASRARKRAAYSGGGFVGNVPSVRREPPSRSQKISMPLPSPHETSDKIAERNALHERLRFGGSRCHITGHERQDANLFSRVTCTLYFFIYQINSVNIILKKSGIYNENIPHYPRNLQ
jgi:hypothetical protein